MLQTPQVPPFLAQYLQPVQFLHAVQYADPEQRPVSEQQAANSVFGLFCAMQLPLNISNVNNRIVFILKLFKLKAKLKSITTQSLTEFRKALFLTNYN